MALISAPFPDSDDTRVQGEITVSPQGRTPRFAAVTTAADCARRLAAVADERCELRAGPVANLGVRP
jgi:hypothetical protein